MTRRTTADSRAWRAIMAMTLCALLGVATLTAPRARAEVAAADPIDFHMRACLARADRSSTAGQIQCVNEARQSWQSALGSAYGQLLDRLPHAQRQNWIISQRRWDAWRAAENPLLDAVFSATDDAMHTQTEADLRLQSVRARALALRAQIALANAGNPSPHSTRPCEADTRCTHATQELDRYDHRLSAHLSARARVMLDRAQRAWHAYSDAMTPLIDVNARTNLASERLATLKLLSEIVGHR